jgi:hypothetical protein
MNATLHHEFDLAATLITIAAVGLTVVLTMLALRLLDWIADYCVVRALRREADEILDRVGGVPRGCGHHGTRRNGVGPTPDFLVQKEE